MGYTVTLLAALSVLGSASFAEAKFNCKQGSAERSVEVVYPEAGKKVPCEVKYVKSKDAPATVIFSAKSAEGFCESKAKEFTDKLKGMGYDCQEE
jgi:hypothetical protein